MTLYQIDAFTNEIFKGNPAGVCILEKAVDSDLMQNIATDMNLSETAFVIIGKNESKIRYYTPTQEVPLCGHATLASTHILYELGIIKEKENYHFKALKDDICVNIDNSWIKMNFPIYEIQKINENSKLEKAVGFKPVEVYQSENGWLVVLAETEEEIKKAKPDFELIGLNNLGELIAVTAISQSKEYDFIVRVFCDPKSGIQEDPVTGSANCILAPYWNKKTGKKYFSSYQASKRTGKLKIEYKENSVDIYGQAKTIFKIDFLER